MTIEHSTITDPDIHEPKGISTATVGQTYVADGAGSGVWTSPSLATSVIVASLSDLPAPSSGVITLADDTAYIFQGNIDIGSNRIQLGTNNELSGINPAVDGITSSTTGALFTGATMRADGLRITVSSGSVFSLTGTAGANTILDQFTIVDALNIGTVDTMGTFAWRYSAVVSLANTGITFVNNIGAIKIQDMNWVTFNGTGIDFGTCTSDLIHIRGTRLSPAGGATSVNIAAASGNLNAGGLGLIRENLFNGAGTAITGYSPGDEAWKVEGNSGIQNSIVGAQGAVIGNATATVFGGLSTPIKVDVGTGFVAGDTDQFSVATDGRITYTGDTDVSVLASANIFGSVAGGAARNYRYYFTINGTVESASVSEQQYDGSNPGNNGLNALLQLSENDYIEVWVEAITATTNLTVETMSVQVIGV